MDTNDAAKSTHCPQCSKSLEFIRLTENGLWKLGMCYTCNAIPAFCQDCQLWFMAEHTTSEPNWDNWTCPSCGKSDLPTVTSPMQDL